MTRSAASSPSDRNSLAPRMIGRKGLEGGWRTPLHTATDWPGYFPAAPAAVALLLEAGANPNDRTRQDNVISWLREMGATSTKRRD